MQPPPGRLVSHSNPILPGVLTWVRQLYAYGWPGATVSTFCHVAPASSDRRSTPLVRPPDAEPGFAKKSVAFLRITVPESTAEANVTTHTRCTYQYIRGGGAQPHTPHDGARQPHTSHDHAILASNGTLVGGQINMAASAANRLPLLDQVASTGCRRTHANRFRKVRIEPHWTE